jgi:flagellar basal-body rod protein FlgG
MNDAFAIAATGMQVQQLHLDTIAGNLANMNTPAYKRARVAFSDIVLRSDASTAAERSASSAGVASVGTTRSFETGELRRTEAPMDLAIQGDGFLELLMADGTRAFTRGGTLKVGLDGQLATLAGHTLKPGLSIPDGADVRIHASGRVQARPAGRSDWTDVGQLEMVRFANPGGLATTGHNVYRQTEVSGEAIAGRPGEDGLGSVVQGSLETSNVKLVDELVQLMMAQRAYEASLKVVQASDEMHALVNGLRK